MAEHRGGCEGGPAIAGRRIAGIMGTMIDTPSRSVREATIVTPCLNAERLIARTAESVMSQTAVLSGRLKLQYLVCDGASTDRTVDVVREICGDRVDIHVERDRGMYEALANGLRRATGDVVSYLNAGDFYAPTALDVVADILDEHGDVTWLMGLHVVYNESGQVIRAHIPFRCRGRLLRKGLLYKIVPFGVQQESTFWRRNLLELVDLDELASFKLAGDAFLWQRFAGQGEPAIVESYLGGWTRHAGQLSSDMNAYRKEFDAYRGRVGPLDAAAALYDLVEGFAPPPVRKWLNPKRLFRYSMAEGRWV